MSQHVVNSLNSNNLAIIYSIFYDVVFKIQMDLDLDLDYLFNGFGFGLGLKNVDGFGSGFRFYNQWIWIKM